MDGSIKNITERKISELADISFACECGHQHSCEIKEIYVEENAIERLSVVIENLGAKKIFVVADATTYEVAGKRAEEILEASDVSFHEYILGSKKPLVPDERALGSILSHIEAEDDLILAVGSGSINDLSRYISTRTGLPYVILCTAPSMDGYASTVSPLIIDGAKVTLPAGYPSAIIADITIMKDAPFEMLTAGFGDIIGKLTCDADWRLANHIKSEYRCEPCAELVSKAVDKCLESAEALSERDISAVAYVTEALILSGVAMGLFGNSRPASGAEHHFAHYWEVDALKKGEEHALHGNSVAVGSLISATIYELVADLLPEGFVPPNKSKVLKALEIAGAPTHPRDIGVSKELLHESVLHAMEIRERYTILRFCDEHKKLEEIADKITNIFY